MPGRWGGPSAARSSTSSWRAATRPARSRIAAWWWRSPRPWRPAPTPSSAPRPATRRHRPRRTARPAGLEVVVVLPAGQIAAGKLVQAQLAGARVVAVDGNFDAALRIVRELVAQGASHGHPLTLVNSVNPHRIAGQKTGAFEVCDDLGGAPDYLAIPVGNAGNITAYWRGFTRVPRRRPGRDAADDAGLPGRGRRAARAAATTSPTRPPWRRPSASAIPPAATTRCARGTNRAA